jgi:hypothetical protein
VFHLQFRLISKTNITEIDWALTLYRYIFGELFHTKQVKLQVSKSWLSTQESTKIIESTDLKLKGNFADPQSTTFHGVYLKHQGGYCNGNHIVNRAAQKNPDGERERERERERGAWPYRHLLACVNKSLFPMKLRGGGGVEMAL